MSNRAERASEAARALRADYFWPMWPMLGLGIALLAVAWQAYGPGEQPITEHEIAEEMRRG